MVRHGLRIALTLVLAGLAACSSEEVTEREPDAAPCDIEFPASALGVMAAAAEQPFFPLEVGNRWVYRREFFQQIVVDGEPPPNPIEVLVRTERQLIGFEEVAGITYTVEEEQSQGDLLPGIEVRWWRHRQDDSGLYRRIMDSTQPPVVPSSWGEVPDFLVSALDGHKARVHEARTALDRAATADEVLRVAYPLEAGKTWMTTDDGTGVLATVEAMETLDLDVGRVTGWRVRFEPNGTTSEDTLKTWTGTCGVLQSVLHIVTRAQDPSTGQTATITTRELECLTELDLAGRE